MKKTSYRELDIEFAAIIIDGKTILAISPDGTPPSGPCFKKVADGYGYGYAYTANGWCLIPVCSDYGQENDTWVVCKVPGQIAGESGVHVHVWTESVK